MKLVGVISTAVLSLALGVAVPAFAQEQHEQEGQKAPAAQDEKRAQPEKSTKQAEKPAAQPEKNTKPEEKNAQQENKNAKPAEKNAPEQKAAGNRGGQIPADKFKANFGQQHSFRVSQGDYNNHRFQYGGYSFGFVDPWPSNWLYTQNVYVIEINGVYYLCNASFPGVNLVLSFTL
jgi:type IV secretory pathway VirB10-like protein